MTLKILKCGHHPYGQNPKIIDTKQISCLFGDAARWFPVPPETLAPVPQSHPGCRPHARTTTQRCSSPIHTSDELVNLNKKRGKITIFNGKTHYRWVIFNSYVKLPEGISLYVTNSTTQWALLAQPKATQLLRWPVDGWSSRRAFPTLRWPWHSRWHQAAPRTSPGELWPWLEIHVDVGLYTL
jgi:hypothetical protein